MTELASRAEFGARGFWRSEAGVRWRSAVLLGLFSSTYSTVVSQLTAGRIGRDALVDWMVVASIPARESVLAIEPSAGAIAIGIAFHQWADFSWELFFFGVLGRWTGRLSPFALLAIAPFWAFLTSALEWAFLVPLFPFRQPIFPLEQPYWIGFLVHWASASTYPFFPWLQDWVAGRSPSPWARFTAIWAALGALGVCILGLLAFLGAQDRELRWMGKDESADQAFFRRMSAHHAQGIALATLASQQASDPQLRSLARLMAAEQIGENKTFDQWSKSWFGVPPQACSPDEQANMPGMLSDDEMQQARRTTGREFDALFIDLMSRHHAGAALMADQQMRGDGDFRLKVMAQAIRHGQQGEIDLMHGVSGASAVRNAVLNLVSLRQDLQRLR